MLRWRDTDGADFIIGEDGTQQFSGTGILTWNSMHADQNKYECSIHETKPKWCRDFPIVVSTECENCHLNFVKYFKDTVFPEMSLEEYFKWTLDDFFEKVLKNVECCPKCGDPIPKLHQWALDNCPAEALRRKPSVHSSM